MAAVDREITINYGGFIVGGAVAPGSERLIDGALRIDKSFTSLTVSFDFVITGATEAAFAAEVTLCEAAFRDPFLDLNITQGATTLVDCSPSTNTGLNTQPSITKGDSPADTGRSRRYLVSIEAEMPADNSPTVGIRESSINVAFSPSRKRTVTISGVVTAEGGNESRAKYNSIINAYTAAILTALGGIYELALEPDTTSDFQDKLISFSRTFNEIIFSQGGAAVDDVRIVDQQFSITRNQVAPGDTTGKNVVRMIELSALYNAWIDKDETQDLSGVWDSIKDWVYSEIAAIFGAGSIAVTSVAPTYFLDENRISASISALAASASGLLEHRETIMVEINLGKVLVPVWNGDAYGKYLYLGPATKKKTQTTIQKELAGSVAADAGGSSGSQFTSSLSGREDRQVSARRQRVLDRLEARRNPAANSGPPAKEAEYTIMTTNVSETPLTIGTDNQTLDIVETTTIVVSEAFVEAIPASPQLGTGTQVTDPASGAAV